MSAADYNKHNQGNEAESKYQQHPQQPPQYGQNYGPSYDLPGELERPRYNDVWAGILISTPIASLLTLNAKSSLVPNYPLRLRRCLRYRAQRLLVHEGFQWRRHLQQRQRLWPWHKHYRAVRLLSDCCYFPKLRLYMASANLHEAVYLGNRYFQHPSRYVSLTLC